MVDVAKKAGCTYTTVYSALFRPNLISKATTKRVIRVIKSMGGDLSKVSQPHFRTKKVTIAVAPVPKPVISSPVNKTISWKVIPEQDVKPGDMAIQSKEGRMIFMRSL
jgi:DNA-binding LacI/PurR family transcriptional regulator